MCVFFCEFGKNTRCSITRQHVSVCVCHQYWTEWQSDGRFVAEIRFQQHPPETSRGLNVFLFLTLSLNISFIPFPPSSFLHLFVCSVNLFSCLYPCSPLLLSPPLCLCLCLFATFFFPSNSSCSHFFLGLSLRTAAGFEV